jgi:uncharacterized paraquat-inducible protein A
MIPVETQWFIFLYLLFFLTAIFTAWVGFDIYSRRVGKRIREKAADCPHCGMTFIPPGGEEIITCPRCAGKMEARAEGQSC